jgi:hypothetical protein
LPSPLELHENGHPSLRMANEGKKDKIKHGEKKEEKEGGTGSGF